MSRSSLFRLDPLGADDLRELVRRALTREGGEADDDAVEHLVDQADGDARVVLNSLEVALALAGRREAGRRRAVAAPRVTLADAEAARGTRALRYGEDDHYDIISAFIKSVRGSDPDAGLYWLARMLEAGRTLASSPDGW